MILLEVNGHDWSALARSVKPLALFAHLGPEGAERFQEEFGHWLLELLRAHVLDAIRTQRFPEDYDPLSPAWAHRKARLGLEPGYWRATGTLAASLAVWRTEEGKIVLGFPADAVSPLNKQKVAVYAAALEHGDPKRGRPGRPLFTTFATRMRKQIYRLLRRFCQKHHPEYVAFLP